MRLDARAVSIYFHPIYLLLGFLFCLEATTAPSSCRWGLDETVYASVLVCFPVVGVKEGRKVPSKFPSSLSVVLIAIESTVDFLVISRSNLLLFLLLTTNWPFLKVQLLLSDESPSTAWLSWGLGCFCTEYTDSTSQGLPVWIFTSPCEAVQNLLAFRFLKMYPNK